MSPVESISLFFQNYVNFQGRSRRAEFWWPFLMNFVIFFMLGFVGAIMSGGETVNGLPAGPALIIIGLYGLAIILPSISLMVRRLHDIGQTGWLALAIYILGIIPLIGLLGFVAQIVVGAIPGNAGPNKYGADPKGGHDVGVFS